MTPVANPNAKEFLRRLLPVTLAKTRNELLRVSFESVIVVSKAIEAVGKGTANSVLLTAFTTQRLRHWKTSDD